MDFVSIASGIVIGLIIGFLLALVWTSARKSSKSVSLSNSEREVKAIFAEQANHHIASSKEAIDAMQLRLEQLTINLQQYEALLQVGAEENEKVSFFGEHTSVFLRNSKSAKASDQKLSVSDAPPRDFANKGSGLFVGNVAEDKTVNK